MLSPIWFHFESVFSTVVWRNWLARGANNAKAVGSSPTMTIHSIFWTFFFPSMPPGSSSDVFPDGSKSHVRLHNSVVRSGKYTYLSHCWGKVNVIKTTLGNQEEMKAGIPLNALPKTYRDAIDITRSLSGPGSKSRLGGGVHEDGSNLLELMTCSKFF